jgi:hypothetical protein
MLEPFACFGGHRRPQAEYALRPLRDAPPGLRLAPAGLRVVNSRVLPRLTHRGAPGEIGVPETLAKSAVIVASTPAASIASTP